MAKLQMPCVSTKEEEVRRGDYTETHMAMTRLLVCFVAVCIANDALKHVPEGRHLAAVVLAAQREGRRLEHTGRAQHRLL